MQPTRLRLLLAVFVIAGAIGWGLVRVVQALTGRLIPVPWLASGAMVLVAAALFYWTILSRPRLQRRPGAKPMPPIVAARTAALAMAASRVGALLAGAYAGLAVATLPSVSTQSGAVTVPAATAAAVGALGIVGVALWLEHLCRLPAGPPDDPNGAGRTRG